ncbi:unnamed protein product [Periconia digitata]|uniref:Uncharacterized protein n=1 Tax=Periconia digitata TaxID=1303443 RepID=A0A9W4UTA5_9PLEO|nr:unnamed protein product [Periconia digitata]
MPILPLHASSSSSSSSSAFSSPTPAPTLATATTVLPTSTSFPSSSQPLTPNPYTFSINPVLFWVLVSCVFLSVLIQIAFCVRWMVEVYVGAAERRGKKREEGGGGGRGVGGYGGGIGAAI